MAALAPTDRRRLDVPPELESREPPWVALLSRLGFMRIELDRPTSGPGFRLRPRCPELRTNNMQTHAVRNDGDVDRIHLIFELFDPDQPLDVPA